MVRKRGGMRRVAGRCQSIHFTRLWGNESAFPSEQHRTHSEYHCSGSEQHCTHLE
jgi:hypothetical protein